jgi:hypothetical protein
MACVQDMHRAGLRCQRQCFIVNINRNGPGAEGGGDHHCREAQAAASVDGEPIAGGDLPLNGHGPVRRRQTAAEGRRRHKIHFRRQSHQVEIRVTDRHRLGERAPSRESGLKLMVAHMSRPDLALGACTASGDERHGDAIAGPPFGH